MLSYRKETRIHVRRAFSEWAEVTSGVTQGLLVFPLLFSVCVNELPAQDSCMHMYEDDAMVLRK